MTRVFSTAINAIIASGPPPNRTGIDHSIAQSGPGKWAVPFFGKFGCPMYCASRSPAPNSSATRYALISSPIAPR